jgi:hypothetical protein
MNHYCTTSQLVSNLRSSRWSDNHCKMLGAYFLKNLHLEARAITCNHSAWAWKRTIDGVWSPVRRCRASPTANSLPARARHTCWTWSSIARKSAACTQDAKMKARVDSWTEASVYLRAVRFLASKRRVDTQELIEL